MSAFVVDTECMDRCVRTICAKGTYVQIIPVFAGIDTSLVGAHKAIGRRLFTLNVEAVQQRYPDTLDNPSNMPGPHGAAALPFNYRYSGNKAAPSHRDLIHGVKSLVCLSYQCAEGDVPDKANLYAELEAAIGTVSCVIVKQLPEYEKAPWG